MNRVAMASSGTHRAVLLIAAAFLCAQLAQAVGMTVTLKVGKEEKKIPASRVVFQSGGVKILPVSGAEISAPCDRIVSIEPEQMAGPADAARLDKDNKELQRKNREFAEKNKQLESELLKLHAALKSSTSVDSETSLTLLKSRIGEMRAELEKKNAEITTKNEEIARLKPLAEIATRQPVRPQLEIGDLSVTTTTLKGVVRVEGRIASRDRSPYASVVLEVSVLDSAGRLLGQTHTFLTKLDPGAPRIFTADLECAASEGQMKAEAVVVMARADNGEWKADRKRMEQNK
jgi:hypothetical protein